MKTFDEQIEVLEKEFGEPAAPGHRESTVSEQNAALAAADKAARERSIARAAERAADKAAQRRQGPPTSPYPTLVAFGVHFGALTSTTGASHDRLQHGAVVETAVDCGPTLDGKIEPQQVIRQRLEAELIGVRQEFRAHPDYLKLVRLRDRLAEAKASLEEAHEREAKARAAIEAALVADENPSKPETSLAAAQKDQGRLAHQAQLLEKLIGQAQATALAALTEQLEDCRARLHEEAARQKTDLVERLAAVMIEVAPGLASANQALLYLLDDAALQRSHGIPDLVDLHRQLPA